MVVGGGHPVAAGQHIEGRVVSARDLARQRGEAGQRRDAAVDQSRERDGDGRRSSGHCGLVAGAQRQRSGEVD